MALNMDTLLMYLGRPGRYQIIVCLLLCFNYFQITFNHLCMAFFGAPPLSYRCDAGALSAATNLTDNSCPADVKADIWCKVRENCTTCNHSTPYVTEEREWTIVTEFDLVCDQKYLSNLATTIYFVGVMVGGVFFGHVADAIGRFPVLIACLYLPVGVGIGMSFAQSYVVFAILRFFMGFLMQGLQIVNVSMIMEYFSPKHRGVAACVLEVFWGLGVFILALIAYLIRDWRWMQRCFSLLILLTVFYVWLFPESLRWLLSKRKYLRAEKLTQKIAKYNGLSEVPPEAVAILKEHEDQPPDGVVYNISHIFRNRNTLKRSIILWYIWFAVSIGYYGLILNTGRLDGFKYTNFIIGAGVEIGAYLLAILILYYCGRRWPMMAYFAAGGIACIVAGNITDQTAKTVLALVGRFGMAGAFSVMFLYTSELYPTVLRNVGLGSCVFWTRIGGLLAPQINLLGAETYKPLPFILFGALSIAAAILGLLLPETLNRELPDTLEDSENMGWGCARRSKAYNLSESKPTETKQTKF
ncbi:organic cation transporter protein-like [Liolophura sinensis]|uniref:organic cation transporter protein-like n=1 Tax=Liolophura sinensis TaxID=3198878 RepID=UPI0031580524